MGLVEERVKQADCKNGFILDGFPRNTAQAEALDKLLNNMGMPLDSALSVDVPKDDLMKRLTGRRTCKSCQQMYNVYYSPPRRMRYVINAAASFSREVMIKRRRSRKGLMFMMHKQHLLWTITRRKE